MPEQSVPYQAQPTMPEKGSGVRAETTRSKRDSFRSTVVISVNNNDTDTRTFEHRRHGFQFYCYLPFLTLYSLFSFFITSSTFDSQTLFHHFHLITWAVDVQADHRVSDREGPWIHPDTASDAPEPAPLPSGRNPFPTISNFVNDLSFPSFQPFTRLVILDPFFYQAHTSSQRQSK